MIPETGTRESFKQYLLAQRYVHLMYRYKQWKNDRRSTAAANVWMVREADADYLWFTLVGTKKIRRVPRRLFERWLKAGAARQVTGKG